MRPLFRPALACALAASIVAAAVGVPVFPPRINAQGKDVSRPFPCQHSACGCQNAEACWRGCCCHTEREKLAWAERHAIEPPPYVHAAAEKERRREVRQSCCQAGHSVQRLGGPLAVRSVSEGLPRQIPRSNVAEEASECCGSPQPSQPESQPWVCALAARKCRGAAQFWMVLSTAIPAGIQASPSPVAAECGLLVLTNELFLSLGSSPATPPPRV